MQKPWTGITPVEIGPLNTSTKLAYRCPSCGAEGHFTARQPINVNDAGEPMDKTALEGYECPKCREPYTPQATELRAAGITPEQMSKANFMKGRGCNHCRQTGFRGRQGLFEMMRMTSIIRELTFAQAPTQELRRKARAGGGMKTLLDDGVMKILKGVTTFDEVLSTCHAEVLVAQET